MHISSLHTKIIPFVGGAVASAAGLILLLTVNMFKAVYRAPPISTSIHAAVTADQLYHSEAPAKSGHIRAAALEACSPWPETTAFVNDQQHSERNHHSNRQLFGVISFQITACSNDQHLSGLFLSDAGHSQRQFVSCQGLHASSVPAVSMSNCWSACWHSPAMLSAISAQALKLQT